MPICNRSAKMAPVRAEKQNRLFQNLNFDIVKNRILKVFLDLKTVHFAYKPISGGLF